MLPKNIYKIIILAISLHFIGSAQAIQSADSVSSCLPRIGNEIDRYARDYFRLFPAITDFDHAVVTCDTLRNTSFRISRQGKIDTVIALDRKHGYHLFNYLHQFEFLQLHSGEEYASNQARQNRDLLGRGIIDTGAVRITHPGRVKLHLANDVVTGSLLYQTRDSIVITGDFDHDVVDRFKGSRVFSRKKLTGISTLTPESAGSAFVSGTETGFLVGLALGAVAGANYNDEYGSSRSGSEYGGIVGALMGGFIGGIIVGLPTGVMTAWLTALSATAPEEEGLLTQPSRRVTVQSAFNEMLPPELHGRIDEQHAQWTPEKRDKRFRPADDRDTSDIGVNADAWAATKAVVVRPSFVITTGLHFYWTESRNGNAWAGGEFAFDWHLVTGADNASVWKLNTSAGLGLGNVFYEIAAKYFSFEDRYYFFGLKYQRDYYSDDLGSVYGESMYGRIEREKFFQNVFITAGFGRHWEKRYRELNLSVCVLPTIHKEWWGSATVQNFRIISLGVKWGFDL